MLYMSYKYSVSFKIHAMLDILYLQSNKRERSLKNASV